MQRFREFIMNELESMGETPSKTNDFSIARQELGGFYGLKPKDYLKAPIVSYEPLDFPGQPRTSSPTFIDFEDSDDNGDLKGKMMYSILDQGKLRNPNGTQYTGDLKDKKIQLRRKNHNKSRTLDDLMVGVLGMGKGSGATMPPPGMGGL